jgi:hypothetical protein
MPKDYDSMDEAELIAEAEREGIDLTLDRNGKLDWHDRTMTASRFLIDALDQRRSKLTQYLRDNPQP